MIYFRERSSIWTVSWWLATCLTLGLYLIWWWNHYLEIDDYVVRVANGWPSKWTVEIPINKITDVELYCSLAGKLLDYGELTIHPASREKVYFKNLHQAKHAHNLMLYRHKELDK